jgi:hypothetical protein
LPWRNTDAKSDSDGFTFSYRNDSTDYAYSFSYRNDSAGYGYPFSESDGNGAK